MERRTLGMLSASVAVVVVMASIAASVASAPRTLSGGGGAVFVGGVGDFGNDTNSDGIYDYLTVTYSLSVTDKGTYTVRGQLYGHQALNTVEDENLTTAFSAMVSMKTVEAYFSRGTYPLSMSFKPYGIYNSGLTMPWNIELALYDSTTMARLDNRTHTTAPYQSSLFLRPGLEAASIASWSGQDLNGDHYYDTLNVNVSFLLNQEGYYSLSAGLYSNNGTQMFGLNYQAGTYSVAPVTVGFQFNVSAYSGTSGPYPITVFVRDDQAQWTEFPYRAWEDYVVQTMDLLLPIPNFGV